MGWVPRFLLLLAACSMQLYASTLNPRPGTIVMAVLGGGGGWGPGCLLTTLRIAESYTCDKFSR